MPLSKHIDDFFTVMTGMTAELLVSFETELRANSECSR